jgi:hypothetical protein
MFYINKYININEMITSSSFVFDNSTKRFTILDIYDDNIILHAQPMENSKKEAFSIKKNKCCIIS